ncbi:hypothetical protein SGUI_2312 [Serinicoccus hydrothermalis]|uniref:Uncharacterized protein n=1 Tax=Serinicoccus hydrothermalis TaxID=1758689 RepID=A0A1B1NE35_9MICO|nr:pyridoxamine 5'-phosphate oxidase family protein [Serinicoccus hydrothermalis]ANS79708.1 hypothetical protein SGUI_2312 [Serinicoccus hydrothermalis]
MTTITAAERRFLRSGVRSLARIATVDEDGLPHVVPGGWSWDDGAGELVLGGRDVPTTARAGHVRRSGVAAVSIDGVHDGPGWSPWALLLRGPAVVADGAIRVRPDWSRSWGLDQPG